MTRAQRGRALRLKNHEEQLRREAIERLLDRSNPDIILRSFIAVLKARAGRGGITYAEFRKYDTLIRKLLEAAE